MAKIQHLTKILLLSDSHSYIDERILDYANSCDEIWHCGDFGSLEVIEKLQAIKPIKGVFGNIDDPEIRSLFPEIHHFKCEEMDILMIHIGGYPGKYTPLAKQNIEKYKPKLFISGHSHILKVMFDEKKQLLHLNPGACGRSGWHQVRTMMRFNIDRDTIKDLEVIELGTK